jgi:DNA-binding IclR family transcriptional regulator
MVDKSNPTLRVLNVISLLASCPGDEFSLAELARRLKMSKASAHRLLTTMADADFLSRDPIKKTYGLGMSLIGVGQAALEKHRGLDRARREMARLTADLDIQCSASTLIGGDLVILAKEGVPKSHEGQTRVGERRTVVPPMGIGHIAWDDGAKAASYLAMAAAHMRADSYTWLCEALALIRHRGYAAAAGSPVYHRISEAAVLPVGGLRDDASWATLFDLMGQLSPADIQLANLDEADGNAVGYVSAPVFSAEGKLALQLVLSGFPASFSKAKIERCVDKLCAAAALVTSELHGRMPRMS